MEIPSSSISKFFLILTAIFILVNLDPIIGLFTYNFKDTQEFKEVILYFVAPLAVLIIGTILFLKKMKIGWALLTIVSTYSFLIFIAGFLNYFSILEIRQAKLVYHIMPFGTPVLYIAFGISFLILTYLLNKKDILIENNIGGNMSSILLTLSGLLAIIVMIQN